MSNIDYTLWPNAGGTLGQNKVQIPDGINTTWPEGDVLVGNFVFNKGNLVGFVDTKALIANESKSTTFPYDYVNIQVDKSLEGVMTFNEGERTKYLTITYSGNSGDTIVLGTKYANCRTVDEVVAIDPDYITNDIVDGVWNQSLEKLEDNNPTNECGAAMFAYCSNLTTFTSDLSSLTNGYGMFQDCSNLTTFTSDLSSLTNGCYMFAYCSNLTTFTSDLSSLMDGYVMFRTCSNLTTFTSDLPSLTDGSEMFYGCENLTTFTSDLSSLTNGWGMFQDCSNLTTFTSDLSSLTNGYGMFQNCKLNTASVKNIADTIKDVRDLTNGSGSWEEIYKTIRIDIGNSSPTNEEHTYLTQIYNKGWSVYVNGSWGAYVPATASLDETGETQSAPIPFWAKPVPATEETAKYVDAAGNFYNILGAQFIFVNDPDTYGMFINEEDAAMQMRLTKIGEEEIPTA